MALLKYGAIGTEIKGSIGGTTFQSGKAGFVIKNKPNFKPQLNQTRSGLTRIYSPKKMLAEVSGKWRLLTDVQRAGWQAGAVNYPQTNRFGDTYTPSGYQVFITLNTQMKVPGLSYLTTCPLPISVAAIPSIVIDPIDEDVMGWTLGSAVPAGFRMAVWATTPKNPSNMPTMSQYKLITYVYPVDGTNFDMSDGYQDIYGGYPNGSTIFFKIEMISTTTGQKGVPLYFRQLMSW